MFVPVLFIQQEAGQLFRDIALVVAVALSLVVALTATEPTIKMDTVTMLGFIILTGIVVNNAILIVHQTLNFIRAGEPPQEALLASVRTRIRPIFMTTATTVFGMLPLVLSRGAGSKLYRGLGSAVLGGLAVSTLFTLVLTPTLYSLWLDVLARVRRKPAPEAVPTPPAPAPEAAPGVD